MANRGRPPKIVENETINTIKDDNIATQQIEQAQLEEIQEIKTINKTPIIKEKRDLSEMILVKNNTQGKLVYVSKRNAGYEIEWDCFGSDNYMELSELVSMRNSYPRYFQDCWVVIDDKSVIEYLGVEKYYENMIDMSNFDDIFSQTPSQLIKTLGKLPETMKKSVSKRAKQLINTGELDSIKIIKTIEEILKVDLSF